MDLNKFTHVPFLKNDAQLKQKKWQITQKKKISQIYLYKKNHVPSKKSRLVIKIKKIHAQPIENKKKKKE